jgi:hypothetical protein
MLGLVLERTLEFGDSTIYPILTLVIAIQFPFDDDGIIILFSKLNLNLGDILAMLHKLADLRGASKDIGLVSEAQTDGTHDGRLARPVWADDEVHVWAGEELCGRVRDKVLERDAHNRAGRESVQVRDVSGKGGGACGILPLLLESPAFVARCAVCVLCAPSSLDILDLAVLVLVAVAVCAWTCPARRVVVVRRCARGHRRLVSAFGCVDKVSV